VESGVKYFKRNFLPGRAFVDDRNLDEQLAQWTAEIADLRVHGTTHERPRDRFAREQPALIGTATQPSFRLAARVPRIVVEDYLVSFETNRYSVPFTLIGQTVGVLRRDEALDVFHHGRLVVTHPLLAGQYQLRILPEHGPGAIARTARQRRSTPATTPNGTRHHEVEVRDLAIYEALGAAPAPRLTEVAKRGPTGVIGTNKPDAAETVACMVEDAGRDRLLAPSEPEAGAAQALIRERQPQFVSWPDWQRLDASRSPAVRPPGAPG
jgi:hypothetical protein